MFVTTSGVQFVQGGKPFYFAGANCYFLLTRAADQSNRHLDIEVLDACTQLGVTVIRTWMFNDGVQWNALQPHPGEYQEKVFQGMDWLLAECTQRGVKVLLTLTNYWPDYGGMQQYVRWCRRSGQMQHEDEEPDTVDAFYTEPWCHLAYMSHLAAVTQRRNSLTGVVYKDDPTIFGWELANEPRCNTDPSGATLQRWISYAAAHLRQLDPNHLITTGSEGFFGPSTPELISNNPYNGAESHGVDFVRQHQDPNIDFCSMHLYMEEWCGEGSRDAARLLAFAENWINSHAHACRYLISKPLVLGEFGMKLGGCVSREACYQQVLSTCLSQAINNGPLCGAIFWMLSAASYQDPFAIYHQDVEQEMHHAHAPATATIHRKMPHHATYTHLGVPQLDDPYTLHPDQQQSHRLEETVVSIIRMFADRMQQLNQAPTPAAAVASVYGPARTQQQHQQQQALIPGRHQHPRQGPRQALTLGALLKDVWQKVEPYLLGCIKQQAGHFCGAGRSSR